MMVTAQQYAASACTTPHTLPALLLYTAAIAQGLNFTPPTFAGVPL
jgi:hypothetical protein